MLINSQTKWIDNLQLLAFLNILRKSYPHIGGLTDPAFTLCSPTFVPKINDKAIFILNTSEEGHHWIAISNIGCKKSWRVYNSSKRINAENSIRVLMKKLYPRRASLNLEI